MISKITFLVLLPTLIFSNLVQLSDQSEGKYGKIKKHLVEQIVTNNNLFFTLNHNEKNKRMECIIKIDSYAEMLFYIQNLEISENE